MSGGTVDAQGWFDYSTVINAGELFTWGIVFDGSLSGNANRLKLFINGVQQTLTFDVTVDAILPTTAVPVILFDRGPAYTPDPFTGIESFFGAYSDAKPASFATKFHNWITSLGLST